MDQMQGLSCRFCCGRIGQDVEAEFQVYSEEADYYDSGRVTKDYIRKDILRYDPNWPVRRYWLDSEIRILNGLEADPVKGRYQIEFSSRTRERKVADRQSKL